MSRRRKKCCSRCGYCTKPQNNSAIGQMFMPGITEKKAVPAADLLFRPVSYDSGTDRILDFENVFVPFKIEENLIYIISFMDMDLSIYLECRELKDGTLPGYADISKRIKNCLDMQTRTGINYYFGKLDKTYNQYIYILEILVEKGFLEAEKAVELIKEIGFYEENPDSAVEHAIISVEAELDQVKIRRRNMGLASENIKKAGDVLVEFFKTISSKKDENSEEDEDLKEDEGTGESE